MLKPKNVKSQANGDVLNVLVQKNNDWSPVLQVQPPATTPSIEQLIGQELYDRVLQLSKHVQKRFHFH